MRPVRRAAPAALVIVLAGGLAFPAEPEPFSVLLDKAQKATALADRPAATK